MAKVTYHAPEGDSEVVSLQGLRFFDGEPRELDDTEHVALLEKLVHNPHFEVEGTLVVLDETDPPAIGLRAVHRGFGRYSIVRGDEDAEIRDGLNKAEAHAFNALSEAEKRAFVG
ncbi:MAG: hypothetical protein EOP24_20095 [Hyphomicrobiales bacterium]|nr:MAG: hypothetical protein EOP24_20095 [Hyphomicrobiales bacterium]